MKLASLWPVGAVLLTSCTCHQGTVGLAPELLPAPAALTLSACPSKDSVGRPVSDVFPAVQRLTVSNSGKVDATLALRFSGAEPTAFASPGAPTAVPALGSVDVPVTFAPTHGGLVQGALELDDGDPATTNATVQLSGTGLSLPAQPTLLAQAQRADGTGFSTCQAGSALDQCLLSFPDTPFGQTSTLQLKLRNVGCPTLRITALTIGSSRGDTQGFSIASPAVLPSAGAPLAINLADGTDERTLTLRFTPTDDGSGNDGRLAYLAIASNDPATGSGTDAPSRLGLMGRGQRLGVHGSPALCDLANAQDLCGYATAPSPHTRAQFLVVNDGTATVQLGAATFASSGTATSTNGRFQVTRDVAGLSLTPGGVASVELTSTDAPLYVVDTLRVPVTAGGATLATPSMQVGSGTRPCLVTTPADLITFSADAGVQTATVQLGDDTATGCGPLTLGSVSVDPSAFFSLVGAAPDAGTVLQPGGSLSVQVRYRPPIFGGLQLGALRIQSNDPSFGPPGDKVVELYSEAPFDRIPIAGLTVCTPAQLAADPSCHNGPNANVTVSLGGLGSPRLTFSGATSNDDHAVAKYRFTLQPPLPSGITTAALAGSGVIGTSATTTLDLTAGVPGHYLVSLEVWDTLGQQAGNVPVLDVNVKP